MLSARRVLAASSSAPWTLGNVAFVRALDISSDCPGAQGVAFNAGGTFLTVADFDNQKLKQFNVSPAWDLSSVTAAAVERDLTGLQGAPRGIAFSASEDRMYVVDDAADSVVEYTYSGAVSTMSRTHFTGTFGGFSGFRVNSQDTSPGGIVFRTDGTRFYITGVSTGAIYEYNLSSAWDTSTASYSRSYSVTSQETAPRGVAFNPDGTRMLVVGSASDAVHEYSLSTAWNVTTASFVRSASIAAQDGNPRGLFVRSDGARMYITGIDGDSLYEYRLSPY
jgi:DNA-binding beta-propeller fold protein YncE